MAKGKISQKQLKLVKEMLKKSSNGNNLQRNIRGRIILYLLATSFFTFILFFKIYVHYSYIKKLQEDNCKCSEDWKSKWVRYGPILQICIGITLGVIQYIIYPIRINKNIGIIIGFILPIIYIIYVYNLIKIDCQCSVNWKRTFILFFSFYIILMQIITLIYNINV